MQSATPEAPRDAPRQVLCVDLDGTLVSSDTLFELVLRLAGRSPLKLFLLPLWLLQGKAVMKTRLADAIELPVESLPYNREFLDFLHREREVGRTLVLATAAPARVASAIAAHLGVFSRVIATNAGHNLRGSGKSQALTDAFGEGGFVYAGNDRTDLAVWKHAAAAIVVSNSASLRSRITVPIERSFDNIGAVTARGILRALRVHQWVKNVLVFVPMITANAWSSVENIRAGLLAFACLSLIASGVYLINDLLDLDADRLHPRKCKRPFASGALPLQFGLAAGPLLVIFGLAAAWWTDPAVGLVLSMYFVVTTLYSWRLKQLPLVDVFTLASLYTIRVVAGGAAAGIELSTWLLSYSGLLFLSLAFLKRYVEVADLLESSRAGEQEQVRGRGYFAREAPELMAMGIASAFASAIVLAMYLDDDAAANVYGDPRTLWYFVPLSLFWLCRLWLSAGRGYVDDDPIVYAAKDWVTLCVAAVGAAIYLAAVL